MGADSEKLFTRICYRSSKKGKELDYEITSQYERIQRGQNPSNGFYLSRQTRKHCQGK